MTVTCCLQAVATACTCEDKLSTATTPPLQKSQGTIARAAPPRSAKRLPFTVGQLRQSIPPHCFHVHLPTSLAYLAFDLLLALSLLYLGTWIGQVDALSTGRWVWWMCYWASQGTVMWALWVLGHECGHGSFAPSPLVNDVIGWLLHSALLVPYFSWQFSHRQHHAHCASLQNDQVFVPKLPKPHSTHLTHHPEPDDHEVDSGAFLLFGQLRVWLHNAAGVVVFLVVGWPLWLLRNHSSNASMPRSVRSSILSPSCPVYSRIPSAQRLVLLSNLGLLLTLASLGWAAACVGWCAVVQHYVVPYFVMNLLLSVVTFLHHTDAAVPHYGVDAWDWLRGALATVDRDYGPLNWLAHHITDTHVVHHLFPSIPHYHAVEATKAVRSVLQGHYRYNGTSVPLAFWSSYQLFYHSPIATRGDGEPGVYWYGARKTSSE